MADNIKLITYAGSSVTPQHDAVMANLELPGNGIIYGCDVTIKNATTLHIASGMGVIYGREFEIMDSDITVQLSTTGTLLGQLYVHMDLSNTAEPIQLLVQTGVSLDDLVDDPEVNITAGVSEMQLATFTIDTSTLDNLQETFTVIENLTGDIEEIKADIDQINSDLTELELTRIYPESVSNISSFNISTCYRIKNIAIIDIMVSVTNQSQAVSFKMNSMDGYTFVTGQSYMADAYSAWDYANQHFVSATMSGVNVNIGAPSAAYVYLHCVAVIEKV